MIKGLYITLFICTVSLNGMAQTAQSQLFQAELKLKENFSALYKSETDKSTDSLNAVILDIFSTSLEDPQSFLYAWDSLNMIGKLHSSDQKLNIYTWFVKNSKDSYTYFGYIQYNKGSTKKPEILLYPLIDKSKGMKNPETMNLSPDNWLACVYYNVYEFNYQRETYYTLLGYNFNNNFSDKKYIEVLRFDKEGKATFGGEFRSEFQTVRRVILEYSAQLVASIRFNDNLKMIVMDHLAPFESMFTGNYRFYGPDGSYDGYEFHKGEFLLRKDVDARNEENRR